MADVYAPHVIIVSSPSGAGKTSVVNEALGSLPKVARAITHTTRPPRKGEQNGIDYHFVSKEQFEEMIKNREFLEYACVYGKLYGTSHAEVDKVISKNFSCILVIDIQGGREVRKNCRHKCYSIFFKSPSKEVTIQRLKDRGTEETQSLNMRIMEYETELEEAKFYDKIIVNNHFDKTVAEFIETVKQIVTTAPHP